MKCPKCDSEKIRAMIKVTMYVDAEESNRLSKKVIAKKSTELWATDHDKTTFVCVDCMFAWGYGLNLYFENNKTEKPI